MKALHNKLVRDKIPEIIEEEGKVCVYRQLEPVELNNALVEKLSEEGGEFLDSLDIEELADILEVIHALIDVNGYSYRDVEKIREVKQEKMRALSGLMGIAMKQVRGKASGKIINQKLKDKIQKILN